MGLRTVLGGIGAAVGFIYGGPAGARWGYMIGSVVGSIVDPQKIKGPSIGDIAAQTSQEGGPRPIVFGMSQPIPGNIIATGAPNIVKSSSSGKGGPKVVTESVFLTYAVGVGEGPIGAFRRIWRNNILVYDATDNPLIAAEESAAFLEKARLFLGTYDQDPSPDLEAIYGVGTTAAHRGTPYMVMAQEDLTDMGGAVPQWQFQVGAATPTEVPIGNINISASANAATTAAGGVSVGVNVGGLLATDTLYIRRNPSGTYVAWSPWGHPNIAGPLTGSTCWFDVLRGGVAGGDMHVPLTGDPYDGYAAAAAAFDAQHPDGISLTGYTNYTFYFKDSPFIDNTGGMSFSLSKLSVAAAPLTVVEVVTAICERAAVPAELLDVTQLAGLETYGLTVINQYPAGQAIQSLADVYRFDVVDYDSQLHFILRGGNSVATITEDDMVEDSNDLDAYRRPESIGIPRVLNLIYYDVTGALTSAKQTSERGGDRRSTADITIESAVIMDAAQAAQLVDISHKVLIEEALGELNVHLSDRFLRLVPTDPIIVQAQGRSERVRIIEATTLDGYQEYKCLRDRQSAYVSTVEGIPPPLPSTPPGRIPGGTLLQVLDIPLLRDVDDSLGVMVYVGVNGITEAWGGAVVEISRDGGATYTDATTLTNGPVIGTLVSDLPDHPQEFPDEINTVLVQLDSIDADLEASDLEGMLNGANMAAIGSATAGWELVQFAGAELQSGDDNTWALSYFLRGRKDTSPMEHVAGRTFVLLTNVSLLVAAPMQLTDLTRTLKFRATTLGTAVADGTVVTLTFEGNSQVERHVGYLDAHRSGSDVVATWQNVGRLGGGVHPANGAHFDGYRMTVSDGVLELSVNTADESETIDVSTLGSPLTVSVLQINNLTGDGPSAEVEIV